MQNQMRGLTWLGRRVLLKEEEFDIHGNGWSE